MKHSCGIRPVLIFMLVSFFAGPVYSSASDQADSNPSDDSGIYEKESFSWLRFYRNQFGYFQSSIDRMLHLSGINDVFSKSMMITTKFLNQQETPSTQFEHSSNNFVKQDELNNRPKQSRYANLSEKLESPVLVPYKYKTMNNMMISMILPIEATDNVTIVPMVSYILSMNGSAKNDFKDRGLPQYKEENIFYGGINLTYSF